MRVLQPDEIEGFAIQLVDSGVATDMISARRIMSSAQSWPRADQGDPDGIEIF